MLRTRIALPIRKKYGVKLAGCITARRELNQVSTSGGSGSHPYGRSKAKIAADPDWTQKYLPVRDSSLPETT